MSSVRGGRSQLINELIIEKNTHISGQFTATNSTIAQMYDFGLWEAAGGPRENRAGGLARAKMVHPSCSEVAVITAPAILYMWC